MNFARDSLVGMGLVLHRLAAAGHTVSALAAEYERFQTVKLQRHCPAEQARAILKRAREAWADRPVDTTDGVKVRLDDGWFILRGSNTEPIVRVMAEGPTEARARAIAEARHGGSGSLARAGLIRIGHRRLAGNWPDRPDRARRTTGAWRVPPATIGPTRCGRRCSASRRRPARVARRRGISAGRERRLRGRR